MKIIKRKFTEEVSSRSVASASSSEIVIIDTGFIVALFNERDEHHKAVKNVAEQIDGFQWYTTSFVVQESFGYLAIE